MNYKDYSTALGAAELLRTIQVYWAQLNLYPKIWTVVENGVYVVRSNMINGKPRE